MSLLTLFLLAELIAARDQECARALLDEHNSELDASELLTAASAA
jgi:hypothetical protein